MNFLNENKGEAGGGGATDSTAAANLDDVDFLLLNHNDIDLTNEFEFLSNKTSSSSSSSSGSSRGSNSSSNDNLSLKSINSATLVPSHPTAAASTTTTHKKSSTASLDDLLFFDESWLQQHQHHQHITTEQPGSVASSTAPSSPPQSIDSGVSTANSPQSTTATTIILDKVFDDAIDMMIKTTSSDDECTLSEEDLAKLMTLKDDEPHQPLAASMHHATLEEAAAAVTHIGQHNFYSLDMLFDKQMTPPPDQPLDDEDKQTEQLLNSIEHMLNTMQASATTGERAETSRRIQTAIRARLTTTKQQQRKTASAEVLKQPMDYAAIVKKEPTEFVQQPLFKKISPKPLMPAAITTPQPQPLTPVLTPIIVQQPNTMTPIIFASAQPQPIILTAAPIQLVSDDTFVPNKKIKIENTTTMAKSMSVVKAAAVVAPLSTSMTNVGLAVTPPPSSPPASAQFVDKKQERMIKNRESACLSRKRKKEYVQTLQEANDQLKRENEELALENLQLKQRIAELTTRPSLLPQAPLNIVLAKSSPMPSTNTNKRPLVLLAVLFVFGLNILQFMDLNGEGPGQIVYPALESHHNSNNNYFMSAYDQQLAAALEAANAQDGALVNRQLLRQQQQQKQMSASAFIGPIHINSRHLLSDSDYDVPEEMSSEKRTTPVKKTPTSTKTSRRKQPSKLSLLKQQQQQRPTMDEQSSNNNNKMDMPASSASSSSNEVANISSKNGGNDATNSSSYELIQINGTWHSIDLKICYKMLTTLAAAAANITMQQRNGNNKASSSEGPFVSNNDNNHNNRYHHDYNTTHFNKVNDDLYGWLERSSRASSFGNRRYPQQQGPYGPQPSPRHQPQQTHPPFSKFLRSLNSPEQQQSKVPLAADEAKRVPAASESAVIPSSRGSYLKHQDDGTSSSSSAVVPSQQQQYQVSLYTNFNKRYQDFERSIRQDNQTSYVVSFRRDHVVFPSLVQANKSRQQPPRMSLIVPALLTPNASRSGDDSSDQQITFMQIECEVLNTRLIHMSLNNIPLEYLKILHQDHYNQQQQQQTYMTTPSSPIAEKQDIKQQQQQPQRKEKAIDIY